MRAPQMTQCQEPANQLKAVTSRARPDNDLAVMDLSPTLVLNTILQFFDFSDAAQRLARRAAALALRSNARLHLLHIIEPTCVASEPWTACGMALDSERAQFREKRLRAFIIEDLPPNLSVQADVRIGLLADEVVACANAIAADLLVMPSQVDPAPRRMVGRSAAELIARRIPCPSLMVPQSILSQPGVDERLSPSHWKTILVPVDFSRAALGALKYAATLAHRNGGRVAVLHVAGPSLDSAPPWCFQDQAERSARDRLATWVELYQSISITFETIVRIGLPPATAILLEAKRLNADLLVLGLSPLRWPHRLGAHRTADSILRNAGCPVLSVPEAILPATQTQPQAA